MAATNPVRPDTSVRVAPSGWAARRSWNWLVFLACSVGYMALAALIVGLDVHMAVLMVSALLWFYGWVTASIQMADWFEYVRRYSPRKSAWLGILFFVIAGPLPIGFILFANAHRLSAKYGL